MNINKETASTLTERCHQSIPSAIENCQVIAIYHYSVIVYCLLPNPSSIYKFNFQTLNKNYFYTAASFNLEQTSDKTILKILKSISKVVRINVFRKISERWC